MFRRIVIVGGILAALFILFNISLYVIPVKHLTHYRVFAQTVFELTCPLGTTSLQALQTTDTLTGKDRQNYCIDISGNVTQNISGSLVVSNIFGNAVCDGVGNLTLSAAITAAGNGGTVIVPRTGCPNLTSTISVSNPIHIIFYGSISSSASPIFAFTGTGGLTLEGIGSGSTPTTLPTITTTAAGGKLMTLGDGTNPFRGVLIDKLRFSCANSPTTNSTITLNANLGDVKFRDLFLTSCGFDGTAGNYAIIIHDRTRVDNAISTAYNYNCAVACAGVHFWGTYANGTTGVNPIGYDLSNITASFVSTHSDNNSLYGYRFGGDVRMYGTDSEVNGTGITIQGSGNFEIVGHHTVSDTLPIQINSASANVTLINPRTSSTVGSTAISVSATSNGQNRIIDTSFLDKPISVSAGGTLFIDAPSFGRVSSTYTNATTTASNIPGLSFPVLASSNYAAVCDLYYQGSAATAGLDITVTGPAAPSNIFYSYDENATSTSLQNSVASSFGTKLTGAASVTATTNLHARITLSLLNGANPGTVQLQGSATGVGTVTVQTGSFCRTQQVL